MLARKNRRERARIAARGSRRSGVLVGGVGVVGVVAASLLVGAAPGCKDRERERDEKQVSERPTKTTAEATPKPTATTSAPATKRTSQKLSVPAPVRRLLEPTMLDHGDNMESLLWSVLMLDHETTETLAEWLAAPSPVVRPTSASDMETLNAALPAEFFAFQDSLRASAIQLRDVARSRDDAALGPALANVVSNCVSCHALFKPTRAPAETETETETKTKTE